MTWVDLVVLGVMFLSGLIAFMRGLVREVLTIGAWLGAAAVAITLMPAARPYVSRYVPAPEWTDPAATYILLFLVSLIIFSLIAKTIGHAVRSSAIGGIDRTLGLVFGLARGAALAIVGYMMASLLVLPAQWPEPVPESQSLPTICKGAAWVARQMIAQGVVEQSQYWQKAQECPERRQTAPDGILKPSPTGRAIDPPLPR